MKKGRGKNKGNAFERKVSLLLAEWWKVPKGTFWRSKISGGSNEPGDITPRVLETDDKPLNWPFVIECKHYKEINIPQLLVASKLKNGGRILSWWKQVTKDQGNTSKIRLLIFRGNNTPVYVAFATSDFSVQVRRRVDKLKDILHFETYTTDHSFSEYVGFYICTWDNFSSVMTKDLFMKEEE